ncbi:MULTISPECIES: hypothetical protein [unclassified Alteromonas]|uniref:hypothetical protein n=1 Tax=unclassified Alteromonas TaxID=2614992 RepID=UPI001359BB9B|nr:MULTISPECIES: hypothetical protein [unclassified Alteromonas]
MQHRCGIRAYMGVFTASFSLHPPTINLSHYCASCGGVGLGMEPYAAWMLNQSLHGCIHGEFLTAFPHH